MILNPNTELTAKILADNTGKAISTCANRLARMRDYIEDEGKGRGVNVWLYNMIAEMNGIPPLFCQSYPKITHNTELTSSLLARITGKAPKTCEKRLYQIKQSEAIDVVNVGIYNQFAVKTAKFPSIQIDTDNK